jgi:arginine decarboxylase
VNGFQNIHDRWTTRHAADTYGIDDWGNGYFHINDSGEVVATPSGEGQGPAVSLTDICKDMRERCWSLPVLLRF